MDVRYTDVCKATVELFCFNQYNRTKPELYGHYCIGPTSSSREEYSQVINSVDFFLDPVLKCSWEFLNPLSLFLVQIKVSTNQCASQALRFPSVICYFHLFTLLTSKTPSRILNFLDFEVFVVITSKISIPRSYDRRDNTRLMCQFQLARCQGKPEMLTAKNHLLQDARCSNIPMFQNSTIPKAEKELEDYTKPREAFQLFSFLFSSCFFFFFLFFFFLPKRNLVLVLSGDFQDNFKFLYSSS